MTVVMMMMMMMLMIIVKSTVASIYCLIWFVRFGRSPMPFSFYFLQARDRLSAWYRRHSHCPALEIRNLGFNRGGYAAPGGRARSPSQVCLRKAGASNPHNKRSFWWAVTLHDGTPCQWLCATSSPPCCLGILSTRTLGVRGGRRPALSFEGSGRTKAGGGMQVVH